MDNKLLKAILAMDSYNRSYNEGILNVPGNNQLGNVTIISDSEDLGFLQGTKIRKDIPIGFYAIAYKDNTTNKVTIAYRGTDQFTTGKGIGGDIPNGYSPGGGRADAAQARMAFEFFDAVAAQVGAANMTVTGHSMGGGLAGLVGAVRGVNGEVFEHMDYTVAANNLIAARTLQLVDLHAYDLRFQTGTDAVALYSPAFLESVFGVAVEGAPPPPPAFLAGQHSTSIDGQALDRLTPGTPDDPLSLGPDVDLTGRDTGIIAFDCTDATWAFNKTQALFPFLICRAGHVEMASVI